MHIILKKMLLERVINRVAGSRRKKKDQRIQVLEKILLTLIDEYLIDDSFDDALPSRKERAEEIMHLLIVQESLS